jgi:hypothetical protein
MALPPIDHRHRYGANGLKEVPRLSDPHDAAETYTTIEALIAISGWRATARARRPSRHMGGFARALVVAWRTIRAPKYWCRVALKPCEPISFCCGLR